jgi:hypothetical protein
MKTKESRRKMTKDATSYYRLHTDSCRGAPDETMKNSTSTTMQLLSDEDAKVAEFRHIQFIFVLIGAVVGFMIEAVTFVSLEILGKSRLQWEESRNAT